MVKESIKEKCYISFSRSVGQHRKDIYNPDHLKNFTTHVQKLTLVTITTKVCDPSLVTWTYNDEFCIIVYSKFMLWYT